MKKQRTKLLALLSACVLAISGAGGTVYAADPTYSALQSGTVSGAKIVANVPSTYSVLLPTSITLVPANRANEDGTVTCTSSYTVNVKGSLDPAFMVVVKADADSNNRKISDGSGNSVVIDASQPKTKFVSSFYQTTDERKPADATVLTNNPGTYDGSTAVSGTMSTKIDRTKSGGVYEGTFQFVISYEPIQ